MPLHQKFHKDIHVFKFTGDPTTPPGSLMDGEFYKAIMVFDKQFKGTTHNGTATFGHSAKQARTKFIESFDMTKLDTGAMPTKVGLTKNFKEMIL